MSYKYDSMGPDGHYEVVHERVAIRSMPSTSGKALGVLVKGTVVKGSPYEVSTNPWLRLSGETCEQILGEGSINAWVLIHGKCVGLGTLLAPHTPKNEAAAETAASEEGGVPSKEAQVRHTGRLGEFIVVHKTVVVRDKPAKDGAMLSGYRQDSLVEGIPCDVDGIPWLKLERGFMMMDGASVGLGQLVVPATDICVDLVKWAEQHKNTKAGKQILWTSETEDELRRLDTKAKAQIEQLKPIIGVAEVFNALVAKGLSVAGDITLGDSIIDRVLEVLLRKRVGVIVFGESSASSLDAWGEEGFEKFLRSYVDTLAPFQLRTIDAEGTPKRVLVLLHGYGVRGDDLVSEGEMLRKLMPGTTVVLPEAPIVIDEENGFRSWWPIEQDSTSGPASLVVPPVAQQRLVATMRSVLLRFDSAELIVGGFSQGSMLMAHSLGALSKAGLCARIRGIVILCGLMKQFDIPKGMLCLAVHGDADERVTLEVARSVANHLPTEAFTLHEIAGLGHEISDAALHKVIAFCDRVAPVAQELAKQGEEDRIQQTHQASLQRWIHRIAKSSTQWDDPRFMSIILCPDMVGLGTESPCLGKNDVRYHLHDAGPESQGFVVLFHGKISHLRRDTEALAQSYVKALRLSVCVVDYRQRFSQFGVDAMLVIESLDKIFGMSTKPIIIHAIGAGALLGLHMAMGAAAMPASLSRRLRTLVLDAPIGNFKSLPPMPTGCIAVDPIGNDAKLAYVSMPVCILSGDDECCGHSGPQTKHFMVMSDAATQHHEDGVIPELTLIEDTSLVGEAGDLRLRLQLYEAVRGALQQTGGPAESAAAGKFIRDVIDLESSPDDAPKFSEIELEEIGQKVLSAVGTQDIQLKAWEVRRIPREKRQGQLMRLVLEVFGPILGAHGGFGEGAKGFRQFDTAMASLSESRAKLSETRRKITEAFDIDRLDKIVAEAEKSFALDSPLEKCHAILDRAKETWESEDMLRTMTDLVREGGGTRAAYSRSVKKVSTDLNVKAAQQLVAGSKEISDDAGALLMRVMATFTAIDPSINYKTVQIQYAVGKLQVKIEEQVGLTSTPASQTRGAGKTRDMPTHQESNAQRKAEPKPQPIDVQVVLEHATDGGSITVTVHDTATILDLRKTVMAALGETKMSQVKIVRRKAGMLQSIPDGDELGGRSSFLMMGCSLQRTLDTSTTSEPEKEPAPHPAIAKHEEKGEELRIVVYIDRLLDLTTEVRVKTGDTIATVKRAICADDPTGQTSPDVIELTLPETAGGRLLDDGEKITASYTELDLR